MLHSLLSSFLEDVSKSLEEKLNVQLPALQTSLLDALLKRDVLLQVQLEKLLESYLDSQRIQFSPSPATIIAAESVYTPAMLKGNVSHIKLKFPLATKPDPPHISGVFQAAEEIDAREVAALGYFCQRVDPEGVPFDKAEKFRDLFYSLIRQLCTSIAEDLIPSLDLNGSRFSTLDGSLESTSLALKLFGDLPSLASGPILIVVDELEISDFSGGAILGGSLERI
ncbi:uncharacterized protein K444DRAFT_635891 [Hyaloscypha bicolor E]|uniref:Uncharacterized protein n=1 Tax=Hyaloscypha bicolor E TaxID=1095630 RepID=A0A2J6SQD5_9HELO|nr:uncharacterized protein K444DRAFT_635891 [Hyaloscypha bicolor E]PMD52970.1 hypothetical protein K444DRAFT_635891 [Hyaloscypha bicolor E]